MRPDTPRGFTLIELMVVVVVIGTLAAMAIPKFAAAVRKANEGSTLANLGAIRSALTIYYADNEGTYPADLLDLFRPGSRYLDRSMSVYTTAHGLNRSVDYVASIDGDDTGAWAYINEGDNKGRVFVHCTHTDLKGSVWTQY